MNSEIVKKSRKSWIRLFVILFLLLLTVVVSVETFGNDFSAIARWWVVLFILGITFYPLTAKLFAGYEDKGYLFAKAIGIAGAGWLMWLLSSFHLMKFTQTNCVIVLILCALCNYGGLFFASRRRKGEQKQAFLQSFLPDYTRIAFLELLFLIVFVSFMYIKGYNAKAFGTEKMMDYGFMTSIYRTDYFPVNDFWFTGENLNYYYFGQYLMTFLTKLSWNTVGYGYNLALGMGFAFCVSLVYALVYQILKYCGSRSKKQHTVTYGNGVAHAGAFLAALAVSIAGNGHYIVFKKLVPMMWDILQIPGDRPSYWFPNSTRYIGYMPDTADKTIHEFPSYSFILGDLHAHVINVTFVLTVLGILFAFLLKRDARMAAVTNGEEPQKWDWRKEIADSHVLMIGFMLGIFMMTNYWDFPIYYVVAGAVILCSNAIISGFGLDTLKRTGLHAVVVFGIAQIVALPFNLNFEAMTNGIALAENHTMFYQLVILWGLPVLVVAGFVAALIHAECTRNSCNGDEGKKFPSFLKNLTLSDLFILILGLCAAGLVLMPEVIYIVDIYGGSYKRSNTMFKLVYQAFILFGISMGYIITRFIFYRESKAQQRGGIIALVVLCVTFGYFPTACEAWFGDVSKPDGYAGIEADRYIYSQEPGDASAIEWLQENAQDTDVVLEANGDSYTIYNRVSVLTGLSTVLGWHTHEWLWHNSVNPIEERAADVQSIYTGQDEAYVRDILEKYQIRYIFIGSCEYEKYQDLGMDVEFLQSLGTVVFEGYPNEENEVVYIVDLAK